MTGMAEPVSMQGYSVTPLSSMYDRHDSLCPYKKAPSCLTRRGPFYSCCYVLLFFRPIHCCIYESIEVESTVS